jgi:hypothetical protein
MNERHERTTVHYMYICIPGQVMHCSDLYIEFVRLTEMVSTKGGQRGESLRWEEPVLCDPDLDKRSAFH